MNIQLLNEALSAGELDVATMFPHYWRLQQATYIFEHDFGLEQLPTEPGILLVRGARQYGKSTWLEGQLLSTIKQFGAGSGFYLNGDYIANSDILQRELENLLPAFAIDAAVRRIFIDEITSVSDWEIILKRMADAGQLSKVLLITTGSKATDLRRGAERLPGRKGCLDRTDFLFTPISYQQFYQACGGQLQDDTLLAYLISGGSPIACRELAKHGRIPEYVIELVRNWIEGDVAKSGRQRSALLNCFNVIFRFGGSPVGQAKLAREAGMANNTVANGYIKLLNDLGCIVPAYPIDTDRKQLILRKPAKFHFTNLLVAIAYHPAQIRSVADFRAISATDQAAWYEWLVAQELQRRQAIAGKALLEPQAFWQSKQHEIDFVSNMKTYIEVKRGKTTALEFSWFSKQFPHERLIVISNANYKTETVTGIDMSAFLLEKY